MNELHSALAAFDRPAPFITFYSFKGGVGRSMAVINVAGIIASRGFRVLVIDMDLEAPGISYLSNSEETIGSPEQPGFVDLLLGAVENPSEADLFSQTPAEAIHRYSRAYPLPEILLRDPKGSLRIMPAGRLDEEYPSRLDRLDLATLYHDGTGLALVKAFKEIVQKSQLFDYVFIDSRTGFSDESGICTRDLADYLMLVSGLNKQNVEGTAHFLAALRAATTETKPLQVILSPVPNGEDALVDKRENDAKDAFQRAWGSEILTDLKIPYHPQLALTEEPHIFRRRKGYLFEAYHQIEHRVLSMLGESQEQLIKAAVAALNDEDYVATTALVHRISMVEDEAEWSDFLAFALAAKGSVPENVESATPLYNLVIAHAGPQGLRLLGNFLGRHAISLWREQRKPTAAGVWFELALKALPRSVNILNAYANYTIRIDKNVSKSELLFQRSLEVDPENARTLGEYAHFLWKDRKSPDLAEGTYKKSLDLAPEHARTIGSYGNFLRRVRKDSSTAETFFKRALELSPTDPVILGAYASFLNEDRKDLDTAEAIYKRALDADPKNAHNLGSYANFLHESRKDLDSAETFYKRALDSDPDRAYNLGAYATFLYEARGDFEAAQKFYKRSLELDPADQRTLGSYANFLFHVRRDLIAAEQFYVQALERDGEDVRNLGNYANFLFLGKNDPENAAVFYRRALEKAPSHAPLLGNYATLLWQKLSDFDNAETAFESALAADPTDPHIVSAYATFKWRAKKQNETADVLFRQALDIDPDRASTLGGYANFLYAERKDADAAEVYYKRWLAVEPNSSYALGNYGSLLLETGRIDEGIMLIDRAIEHLDTAAPSQVNAECWMYIYCCGSPERRKPALYNLRRLLEVHSISVVDWDLTGIIRQAQRQNHPESEWLPPLGDVLEARQTRSALDSWSAWKEASSSE